MKKLLVSLLLFLAFLTACGTDPVKDDLLNYINNEVRPLADEEARVLTAYENVTGDNYTNDEDLYNALYDDIVPNYNKFITKIEEIRPKTQEVKDLHELYVSASNKQFNAMTQMLAALEQQDANIISEANDKLSEGRKGIRDWQDTLTELAKKHDVKLELNND